MILQEVKCSIFKVVLDLKLVSIVFNEISFSQETIDLKFYRIRIFYQRISKFTTILKKVSQYLEEFESLLAEME